MAEDSNVLVRLRLLGGAAFQRQTQDAARGLDRLGRAGRISAANMGRGSQQSMSALGRVQAAAGHTSSTLATVGAGAAVGLSVVGPAAAAAGGALGVATIRGLQFNAQVDQAVNRFRLFTRNAGEARSVLNDVQALNRRSLFDLPSLSGAAAYLGNAGIAGRRLVPTLKGVANAAAAAGGGEDRLSRIATALGQIQARGTVTAEEVNQLADAGVNVRRVLKRQFHLSGKELADLGEQGISAGDAIGAITREFTSGKMAAAARRATENTGGQFELLKDNIAQGLGTLSRPLYTALEQPLRRLARSGAASAQRSAPRAASRSTSVARCAIG